MNTLRCYPNSSVYEDCVLGWYMAEERRRKKKQKRKKKEAVFFQANRHFPVTTKGPDSTQNLITSYTSY